MTVRTERRSLLCVANFPSGTGYAWDFIEALYAGVADRLASRGIDTYVAYPELGAPPATLEGSAAQAIEATFRLDSPAARRDACDLARSLGAEVVYLSDRSAWHSGFRDLRRAGVSGIVVHDHASGGRTPPGPFKSFIKRMRHRVPGSLADRVIAVSDFVMRRKIAVDLIPAERLTRIWNSIDVSSVPAVEGGADAFRAELGLEPGSAIVFAACRATPEKGVDVLLRAFDALECEEGSAPALLYAGEGPAGGDLRALVETLGSRERIHLLGYRDDARAIAGLADVVVVPSLWEEAFGLAALEPMAAGTPVIASAVGGIPEVVVDGETGILVSPGDERALTSAIQKLLGDADLRASLGARGREVAVERFGRASQLDELGRVIGDLFDGDE